MNPIESELQAALLLAAPHAIPHLRLFRRNVGVARFGEHKVKFGIKGQSDIYGVFRGGQIIELELKAADGRLSKEQIAWREFCLVWGIPHLVLRALDQESKTDTVTRWLREIREASEPLLAVAKLASSLPSG